MKIIHVKTLVFQKYDISLFATKYSQNLAMATLIQFLSWSLLKGYLQQRDWHCKLTAGEISYVYMYNCYSTLSSL
jgi:hypothetical protein